MPIVSVVVIGYNDAANLGTSAAYGAQSGRLGA